LHEQPPDISHTDNGQARHAIWQLLDRLQMDNREQAARLVELRMHVAGLGPLPATVRLENAAAYRPFDNTPLADNTA
jgi:hypothetical protein